MGDTTTSEYLFKTRTHIDACGDTSIEVSAPEPLGYACASVFKGRTIGPDRASIVWEPARVNYSAYGGRSVAECLLHLSAISYALSLAAQLDVQFPVGSRADEEG